jgi:hypothetical protein
MDDEHENIPGSQVEFGELHESGEPMLRERACRAKDESLDVESTHEEGYEEYGKGEEVYEGKEEHEWEEPGWEHAFEDSYEREEGYIRTIFRCFLSPCYCNIRYCIRCITQRRTVYCLILSAVILMAYGYVVLINDVIAHSYEAREARGLSGRRGAGIHGSPHVIEQTQRFYS